MRILIDIRHLTDPQPAGVGGYTKQLLDALFRLDQENEYVLFASGTAATRARVPRFDAPNVHTTLLPVPNKILNAGFISGRFTLESLFAPQLFDLVFFPNLNFFRTNLPYIITAHDLSFEIFPEFFSAKMRLWHKLVNPQRVFSEARAVLAPSQSTKQDVMKRYGVTESCIHVTPLASFFYPISNIPHPITKLPPRYFLSLCTLEPRKNHLSIIEAYELYRDKTGDAVALVIAGKPGWKSAPILRAAKHSRYSKDIHLLCYVAEEQKAELYKRAEVFLFPSFYEGFALPVLEAMQRGCPVIATHTSSLPELTQDAAVLIDPFNVNDLVVALCEVMYSKQLRETLRARGFKRAENFSWEETAKKTLDIMTNL